VVAGKRCGETGLSYVKTDPSAPEIISFISESMTLAPGDRIMKGAPEGV
jgi:hypothetical protein